MFCRLLLCLVLLITTSAGAVAQQNDPPEEKATTPRALKISDADGWQRVGQFRISPTGQWCAHFLMPADGDGQLIIRRIDDTDSDNETSTEKSDSSATDAEAKPSDEKKSSDEKGDDQPPGRYEFEVGPNSGPVAFSHDSKYAAFIQAPKDKEAKAAKNSSDPPTNKALLLNLQTGDKVEFERVQRFAFAGENPHCLAVHKMKPKGRASGDKGWDGSDLVIHNLKTGMQINIGNVKSFGFNKPGKLLAMIIDAENKSGNGLQLFHVDDSKIESLEHDDARYRGLSWTREGDALALLKFTKDDQFENPRHQLLAFSDIGGANQQKVIVDPANQPAISDSMTISPNRTPEWSEDRDLILFGIHELDAKEDSNKEKKPNDDPKESADDSDDDELAGLVIWHWQDPRLQSMQQKQESRDKNRFDLCVYQVDEKTTLRLANEEIPTVTVSRPHKFAVGIDIQKYERFGNIEGTRFRDVYSIDLKTGKRKLVLEKAKYVFDVSPNGTSLLYYKDDGHFFIYDMAKGTHTNLTQNVKASFVNSEDDHNVDNPPRRPLGWSTDGDHVLLSDGWDIWKVSIDGKAATNLTVNGNKDQIRYRSPFRFDPDVPGIDFSKPVYVTAYAEWTKQAGFGRIGPNKTGVEILIWEDASFGGLNKLKDHEVYSYSRSTRKDSTDYYIGGPDLKEANKLTNSNPHQKNFKWSDGVRLVDYSNSKGVKLQGALHLPADYIEGKKYPTIVYMYEKLSQTAHRYDSPRTGGFSAASIQAMDTRSSIRTSFSWLTIRACPVWTVFRPDWTPPSRPV